MTALPDLLLVLFINVSNVPVKEREKVISNLYMSIDKTGINNDERVCLMLIPSDKDEIKTIPVKCYLDGIIAETPDNIENLVEELRELIAKAEDV